jgi:hypothetical protein
MNNKSETTVEKLLRTAETHDPHVRAAVQLLHEHGKWLRNGEVLRCVDDYEDAAYVDWRRAREQFDAGEFNPASGSELAVLDFAIELGRNRFRLTSLDSVNSGLVLAALATALRLDVGGESR